MKKETKVNNQQGTKMQGKKASADRYLPYYEFLLFDPLYMGMSDRAKILYTFLRSKVKDFEYKQEKYESGEETKSYLDDEGNIFILADNIELQYILQASEPTVIKAKQELNAYGLLLEERVTNKANRLYVLEPSELTERWTWINEINRLREEAISKTKEKNAKRKKKKDPEKVNLKSASSVNLKSVSKTKSKYKSKLTLNTSKQTLNLSIIDSEKIQNYLSKHGDRLTDSKLQAIQELHEIYSGIDEMVFINKTVEALDRSKSNFKGYLNKSLEKYMNDSAAEKKSVREEVKPDWMDEKENKAEPAAADEAGDEMEKEKEKAELAAKWKEWKESKK